MINKHEDIRRLIQIQLDSGKVQLERNKLGQYSTPYLLAYEIVKESLKYIEKNKHVNFLDPAIGTGVFYSALKDIIKSNFRATGFEIDYYYGQPSKELWKGQNLEIIIQDFFDAKIPSEDDKYNLIICNPPYVRHHHLEEKYKRKLKEKITDVLEFGLSGLAGLYCYFLIYSFKWMREDGIGVWLIPSEFLDVKYGSGIKQFLLNKVDLIRIHRFDPEDQQFDDALVSSSVIWFKKTTKISKSFTFSFGGGIDEPKINNEIEKKRITSEDKWSNLQNGFTENLKEFKLGDIFTSKRGLATGDNNFFILSPKIIDAYNIDRKYLRRILPSPRYLRSNIIQEINGKIDLSPELYLLDVRLPEDEIMNDPNLWKYMKNGLGTTSQKYLCKSRKSWYFQEHRVAPDIFVTYMGRKKGNKSPFNFVLNKVDIIANNSYLLLYAKAKFTESELYEIWNYLNKLTPEKLISEGRVYGGGLYKLEPRELLNVDITGLINNYPSIKRKIKMAMNKK